MPNPASRVVALAMLGATVFAFAATYKAPQVVPPRAAPTALRALIVGGGPSYEYNQVSIASNVRYVRRLLPPRTPHVTLFANGDPRDASVLDGYTDLSDGEQLLALMLDGADANTSTPHYSKPDLNGSLDGPSSLARVTQAFATLRAQNGRQPQPLLLYFTGHGSPGTRNLPDLGIYENNDYDLWGDETLSVRALAAHIKRLPPQVPVTVVMVQCYSGAFANLLFENGDPRKPLVAREFAGFFAACKDRTAAGCTSEINEREYRDFTSYFFAALCGRDRVGRAVTGVDYNGDGRVGMDEAYYYAIGHDVSIDTPTATSDAFLRRFVPARDASFVATPYRTLLATATKAQTAALQSLSTRLGLQGEARLADAYRRLYGRAPSAFDRRETGFPELDTRDSTRAYRAFAREQGQRRAQLLTRFPRLASNASDSESRKNAAVFLVQQDAAGKLDAFHDAYDSYADAYTRDEAAEIHQSLLIRFTRLGKSIVLAQRLRSGKDTALRARFARLLVAEGRTLLPPQKPSANPSQGAAPPN